MTKEHLTERLLKAPLCANVGTPCPGMLVAKSWKDAEKHFLKRSWMNFINEIDNRRSELIFRAMGNGGAGWNERVIALNPHVERTTRSMLESCPVDIPPFARQDLGRTVQSMFIELEFSEFSPPLFSIPLELDLLESGHCLCGWKGSKLKEFWEGTSLNDLPDGQFLIY